MMHASDFCWDCEGAGTFDPEHQQPNHPHGFVVDGLELTKRLDDLARSLDALLAYRSIYG